MNLKGTVSFSWKVWYSFLSFISSKTTSTLYHNTHSVSRKKNNHFTNITTLMNRFTPSIAIAESESKPFVQNSSWDLLPTESRAAESLQQCTDLSTTGDRRVTATAGTACWWKQTHCTSTHLSTMQQTPQVTSSEKPSQQVTNCKGSTAYQWQY